MSVIQQRPSQTLLEAVLAIGVILVAVIGSTTLIVTTITAGQSSEDKIVAGNLAREGIEVVRGIRDSNWMKRSMNETCLATGYIYDWDTAIVKVSGLDTCLKLADNQYYYPALGTSAPYSWTLEKCTPGSPADTFNTCLDGESRVSSYQSGLISLYTNNCTGSCTATKYYRQIDIIKLTDNTAIENIDYLNVTATVKWENHGTKSYILTERFYDWR